MLIVRIAINLAILAVELAAIAGVAWLGWRYPVPFAALTAGLALLLGLALERARIRFELPFYFGHGRAALPVLAGGVAVVEAAGKAALAGVVALITFSGTDQSRLMLIAAVFAACLFAGTSVLRRLSISFDAIPSRWGYFRLAGPLGLVYSAGLTGLQMTALVPAPSIAELGRRAIFDLPARPGLNQASEFLFGLKQGFDALVVTLLSQLMSQQAAQGLGILLSVNILTGFVIGIYAVAIAEVVRWLEQAGS